jgi:alkanesulfonate monooxygenase SsuD/methylene tetrahydromethanopterin reductase-like flavin-dependent oxidoreductase (luciferase family)
MRIGVSLKSTYGVDDPRNGARQMIERTRAARDAGLDSLFVGDHHSTGPFAYYQNAAIMGRLLAEWGDAPAGILMLLPLWHPVLAAELLGTLASVASGRFVLQCAIGGGAEQFAAMGVPLQGRTARFEQGLDIIRRLVAGEAVTTTEGPFVIEGARVAPLPAEPLEVWIGASAPPAIDRAARLGDGWMANAPLVPEEAASQAGEYLDRCAEHGRPPGVVAIRRDLHIGADPTDAARVAQSIIAAGYRGFRPEACTYGSVDEVTERFAAYASMGYSDIIVRHLADDHREVLDSLERLGVVRERLRDA